MTYNCAGLLAQAVAELPRDGFDELILVDDGSIDNTWEVAQRLGIPAFQNTHSGYGGNLRFGLGKAFERGADIMVEVHGDGQFDMSQTSAAVAKMRGDDLDFLIGSRFTDLRQPLADGMPWPRYLANIGLSFIERLVLRIPWTEFHPGFRVYRRRFIEKLDLDKGANDYLYSFQIIALAAYFKAVCSEIPVRADYRKPHTSVNYWRASINSFQEMWVLGLYILAKLGVKTGIFK